MNPRASLVVATRNRAEQLAFGLASIEAQAYKGLEIVLIDDGSTDGTPSVIESFRSMLAEVIVLPRRKTGYSYNPSSVLNRAHRATHADVVLEQGGEVCHLNDCLTPLLGECVPGRVALTRCYHGRPYEMVRLQHHLRASKIDLPETVRPESCVTEAGRWPAPKVGPLQNNLYTGAERLAPFLFLGAVHRQDFEAVGGYDEDRRDRNDTDLANRLQARGVRFSFLGGAVAFHLQHEKL